MPRRYAPALFLGLLFTAGCGGPGLHPVHGELVYPDGSPVKELEGSRVVFEGTGKDGKSYSSVGAIDANGKFELTTNKPGDGAPVGMNKVLIERKMIDPEHAAPRVIEAKYETAETSGLEFEVKSGRNEAKFTVEPIKKR